MVALAHGDGLMWYAPVKRGIDILASALLLLLLLPLLLALAIAITMEDGADPLFQQERIGLNGKPFLLYKFRSMIKDAASKGSYFTQENDTRITNIGRFLRKTSLDEIPQLFNVLRGDMSLIGPRPELPAQHADYTPQQWQLRHQVRPGITGLAQVSGRSAITAEQRLECDLAYAGSPSLKQDIFIATQTVMQVLARKNVN